MKFLKSITIALLLGTCSFVQAQDMHFTMFDMAPLELNPTYTGYYSGTFRIGGLYRSQWQGLSVSPDGFGASKGFSGYKTPSAYIDLPFGIPNKKTGMMKSWMGVGVSFYMDQVSSLSNLAASLSLAYHLGLGQQGKTLLSFGLQGGIAQYRTGSAQDYIFEDGIIASGGSHGGINGGIYQTSSTGEILQNNNATVPDFTGGVMLSHRARNIKFQLGGSVNHFTTPKYNFLGAEATLPMTMIASFIMDADITKRLRLKPLVFFHNQLTPAQGTTGGFSSFELNTQLLLGIHFNDAKDITLYLGGGYRFFDAAIARIGLDIKGFKFGFAYDINLNDGGLSSKVFPKQNRGMAFEVALSYTAKLYKVPVITEVLFCPRF